jgi:hypothetical protein
MICYIPGCICCGSENVGVTWRWVVNFNPRQIYPRYSVQNGHYTESWVGPRDSLDALEKGKIFPAGDRNTFLRSSTPSLVTTLPMFPRQLRKTKCFQRIHYKYFIFNTIYFFCKEAAVNDLSQGQLAQDGKFRTLQVSWNNDFGNGTVWFFSPFLNLTNTKHVIFPFILLSYLFWDKFNIFC